MCRVCGGQGGSVPKGRQVGADPLVPFLSLGHPGCHCPSVSDAPSAQLPKGMPADARPPPTFSYSLLVYVRSRTWTWFFFISLLKFLIFHLFLWTLSRVFALFAWGVISGYLSCFFWTGGGVPLSLVLLVVVKESFPAC